MESHPNPAAVSSRARVFVVEDEAMISMFLEDRLRDLGYDFCGFATRADEAIERIPAVAPDVVLMDVNLGPGLSGLDVAERLRDVSDAAFIVLTAYADAALVARATKSGSFAFLTKPFDMPVLAANIELVLAKRASEAQLRTINRRLDRTARALRQRTDELQRMYSLLHTAFEATADGLLVIDRQGVQAANPRACQMWQVDPGFQPDHDGELLRRIAGQLSEPAAFLDAVDDVRRCSATHDGLVLTLHDGRILQASLRPQIMNGVVVGCVASFNDVSGRERAQQALRESEERYRTLFEDAPVALAIGDTDGQPLLANAAMRRLRDTPPRGFEQASLFEPAIVTRLVRQVRAGGEVHREELPFRADDGRVLDTVVTVRPVTLRGAPAILWMLEDITDRKRTQSALEVLSTLAVTSGRSDEFFPAVAQHVARLLDSDAAVVSLLVHGADGPRVRSLGLCLDGRVMPSIELDLAGTPCESILRQPDGIVFCDDVARDYPTMSFFQQMGAAGLAGTALRDSKGRRIGSLVVASRRPIAGRAHVESMLRLFAVRTAAEIERRLEEHRFHDLFDFSPDAILMVDERGAILRANQQAETLFGYSRDELADLVVESLLPEGDRAAHVQLRSRFFRNASARLMGTHGQPLTVRRKDGSTFPADIGLSPLRSEDGLLLAVDVRDVSERVKSDAQRRSLEAQLRHAQKMEAIGTLAGGIAHDFNNLLAAMVANLELARGDVEPSHPAVESLDAIGVAAERARQLVRQILAFSRRNPPQRVVVAPGALVDEVVRLLRATVPRGIQIGTAVQPDAPNVFVDPTQMHQVLMNLATNAWHAIERGVGEITIAAEHARVRPGAAVPGPLAPGDYARFVVADTGKGMAPETIDRMFEPFFTTKQVGRGSGLGLSVVHGIVADHDGAVLVDSAPALGTRVSVYLPASTAATASQAPHFDRLPPGAGRVAFLDDEAAMTMTARRLLQRLGYAVTIYDRPGDLIDAVRSDPTQFDLVISDCNMPQMSGLDVAREIAAIRRDLPLVLMSGYTDRTEEELDAAGIRFRLEKPFTMQELNAVVQRGLARALASSPR